LAARLPSKKWKGSLLMSSNNLAIVARNVSKSYSIAHNSERSTTVGELLVSRLKNPIQKVERETFWALKDVEFDIAKGDVVGVIGRNGAGKSTLLKVLSQIVEPTTGSIKLYGRVGSLLEVGTGFHPELTGRENIYLNGAILGMNRREIQRQFDAIVEFSEVEKFLDTPVKRYSSGMYVRLAFSVAAHLNSEILIVDEVLAVGDAAFQKKCLGKMEDVASTGRTVLFVSHNIGVINSLTKKCLYLKRGTVSSYGPTPDVVGNYIRDGISRRGDGPQSLAYFRRENNPDSPIRITSIEIVSDKIETNSGGIPIMPMSEGFSVDIGMEATSAVEGASLNIILKTLDGTVVSHFVSSDKNYYLYMQAGQKTVRCKVEGYTLPPGDYCVDIGIHKDVNTIALDVMQDFPLLQVIRTETITHWLDRPWGFAYCEHVSWQ
jgi:lipopolysaccharide transport system ATP-binding protein